MGNPQLIESRPLEKTRPTPSALECLTEALVRYFYQSIDLISLPPSVSPNLKQLVDEAHAQIAQLFKSATYIRCDRPALKGSEISHFYRYQRNLVGRHKLNQIIPKNGDVVAVGEFIPIDQDPLRFCDVWNFSETGELQKRETYLASGSKLIERTTPIASSKL